MTLIGALILFLALAVVRAPAAAGQGWYLLIPLRSPYDASKPYLQGIRLLTDKPLSQWSHGGSYTAEACETDRNTRAMVEHRVYEKDSEDYIAAVGKGTDPVVLNASRYLTENANANADALLAARCIASDDARLRDPHGANGK